MAQNDPASLAAQFGGVPVSQSPSAPTSGNDLASQFGGTPVAATPNPNGSTAPSDDFTTQQLPSSGGISINPQSNGIFDVAQREIDKFRQAIKDRTGNYNDQNTAASMLTSPISGPLQALSGIVQSERPGDNRAEGVKNVGKGVLDTLTLPSLVVSPELAGINAEAALNIGSKILENSKTLANRIVSKYKSVPVPDPGAVQAPLRDALRSTANQLAQDHAIPLSPNTSLRDVFKNVGQGLQDKARVVYNALDNAISEATGGKVTKFQDFDKAIDEVSNKMKSALSDPELLDELEAQREVIQKASDEAFFRAAKEHGIDPSLAETANNQYKQGKALSDVQTRLNTHINEGRTELIPDAEAKFSIKAANNKLNRMYDTGRLQQAFGDRTPQTLEDFHQAFTQENNLKDAAKQAAAHNARVDARKATATKAIVNTAVKAIGTGAGVGGALLAGRKLLK